MSPESSAEAVPGVSETALVSASWSMALSDPFVVIYLLIITSGLLLNAMVLYSLTKLGLSEPTKFRRGSALPLAALSLADMLILICIFPGVIPSSAASYDKSLLGDLKCKIPLFTIHSLYAFRTFCWLFISAQRYMAVFHPLTAIAKHRISFKTLLVLFILPATTNIWLLITVVSGPHGCDSEPIYFFKREANKSLHAFDILIFYVLPVVITLALDIRVLFVRFGFPAAKILSATIESSPHRPLRHIDSQRLHKHQSLDSGSLRNRHSAMLRWLAITTVIFVLNFPENVLYFITLFTLSDTDDLQLVHVIARLMYFAQFAFSGLYLTRVVYVRNTRRASTSPSTSSGGKRYGFAHPLPIGFRPRLTSRSVSSSTSISMLEAPRNDQVLDFILGEDIDAVEDTELAPIGALPIYDEERQAMH